MAYYQQAMQVTAPSPREFFEELTRRVSEYPGLKLRRRGELDVTFVRTRGGILVAGILFSILVPGAGFLYAMWLSHRTSAWALRIAVQPTLGGCQLAFEIQAPKSQGELEAMIRDPHTPTELWRAVGLIAAGDPNRAGA